MESWIEAVIIVASSVASAVAALMLVALGIERRRRAPAPETGSLFTQTVFLFEGETLVDATPTARGLLEACPAGPSDWARLSAFLLPRFEGLAGRLATLGGEGSAELTGRGGAEGEPPLRLLAEESHGLLRLALVDPQAEGQGLMVDALSQRAVEDELSVLREAVDGAPVLAWREDAEGRVIWANRTYLEQSGAVTAEDEVLAWPLPRLFAALPPAPPAGARRMKVDREGASALWFDLHCQPMSSGSLNFAIPADGTVKAERALRDFVQTLTKTFADLPIGLAIFDRQRQLQLFNPALIDLLALGPQFLTARPTLYSFLDRLRETRMMPEPKDYRSWRQQMTALEQAAAAGHHCETWSLPSGQTYRVTGRPHPDGAVAFLFEDISSEISLTRRFRTELEMGQEVLDALEEAVIVFQPSGEVGMSNAAYVRLWRSDPAATLGRMTVFDAARHWRETGGDCSFFAAARDFATRMEGRTPWSEEIRLADGRILNARALPLSGGATLVGFRVLSGPLPAPAAPAPRAAAREDPVLDSV